MPLPILVLDSNICGFYDERRLEALAIRGCLRISEVSLYECIARLRRECTNRGGAAAEARDLLFKWASKLAGVLDRDTPVALGGADLTRRIAAQSNGTSPPEQGEHRAGFLVSLWRHIVAGRMTDEHWRRASDAASKMLDEWDAAHFALCNDPEVQIGNTQWKSVEDGRLRAELRCIVGDLSPSALDRLDAQIHSVAYRVHQAKWGARTPKENDGADLQLPIHIGEGCFLVTGDRKFVDLIDASRTYQRPWIRLPDDVDGLPDGPPWGDNGRQQDQVFQRKV